MRLLLELCLFSLTGKGREAISRLAQSGINWEAFLKVVGIHRLYRVVYQTMVELDEVPIPPQICESLRKACMWRASRSLLLTTELLRILGIFEQKDIKVLPLKGPVLSKQIYGDCTIRDAGDVDVLVSPDDAEKASAILIRNGYRGGDSNRSFSAKQRKVFMDLLCETDYLRQDKGIMVEVHWRLFHNRYLFPLSLSEAMSRSVVVDLEGRAVRAMGYDYLLLYLCAHGAQHMWPQLFWLYDIAELLKKFETIDWESFVSKARRLGVERMLVQGILLTNIFFKIPVPEAVRSHASKDKEVKKLIYQALANVVQADTRSIRNGISKYIRSKHYDLRLRRDMRYKILGCLGVMLTSPNDWVVAPLPDQFFFLYYLLRPFIRLYRTTERWPSSNIV